MPARANAGRKIIPLPIKQLKGTDRPDEEKKRNTPLPSLTRPIPPTSLSKRAKQIFTHFVNNRLTGYYSSFASSTYTEMIATYARRQEEVEKLGEFIEKNGYTFETTEVKSGDKCIRAYPQVGQYNQAIKHLHTILVEFGMTPSAAGRVGAALPKQYDRASNNDFDGF